MNEEKICCICGKKGITSENFRNKKGKCYCKKHYIELLRSEHPEVENLTADNIIKNGLPKTSTNLSKNKFYEFPNIGDGVLAIKDRNGHVFIADLEDKEKIIYKTWADRDDTRNNNYASTTVYTGGRIFGIMMHRVVMMDGDNLDNKVVDHRDGNGYDNRKSNLRICSQSENSMNRGPVLGKPVSGITKRGKDYELNKKYSKNYYEARIGYKREEYHKCFNTYEEAQEWRKQKEKELFGEYAVDQRESDGVYAQVYDKVKAIKPAFHWDDPKKEKYYNF